jgi:hypothetical protein
MGKEDQIPLDYSSIYPELNGFLIRPLLVNPPMCTLKELKDGTYNLYDIEMMHQILDIKNHRERPTEPNPMQP